eukprot:scaffold32736_cov124-Isochrysis_galbana.AAC.1
MVVQDHHARRGACRHWFPGEAAAQHQDLRGHRSRPPSILGALPCAIAGTAPRRPSSSGPWRPRSRRVCAATARAAGRTRPGSRRTGAGISA